MSIRKLLLYLAAPAGYIGLGMLLGYSFGDRANNTPLWIGIVLVLAGVLLLGMFISRREDKEPRKLPPSDTLSDV